MSAITLQVLGAFHVRDAGGGEIRIASRKGRALLAYLALRPGESHSRDRLANLLWEDADEELARTSLRQALAALKKSLPAGAQAALLADIESVGIDAGLLQSDLAAFRRSLAVFGIPHSYGNEAERAARAALMLRDLVAAKPWPVCSCLALRIGVAQGQVLCGGEVFPLSGRPTHEAHTLAAQARDGEILISEDIRQSLGERVSTQRVGAALQAHAAPVNAWSLNAIGTAIDGTAAPFVGRRPELAMILASLDRCTSSRHGRAIVVRGEAGIGKTRLVEAVASAAIDRGVDVHSTQIYDFGQSPERRPITALVLSLLGIRTDAPRAEREAAVQRMAALRGGNIDQIIFLSDLIDAPLDAELAALEKAMEVATRQRGRTLALAQIIETAAQHSPQLLIVEDVHWADTDELARLGEIAAVAANCQMLFIMTTRPEGDPISASWRARARGCPVTTVDLAPLAEDEAQQLAAHYPELIPAIDTALALLERTPTA